MEKRKWLWKRRSSLDNKSPGEGESETSESMSSHSEKFSEEQPGQQLNSGSTKGSPSHNPQSPEVTSKALGDECKKENDTTSENSLLKKLSEADQEDAIEKNLTVESVSDGASNLGGDLDESGSNEKEENESVKLLKEKLSAALINVSLKDELVKQHSKVAEEAVEGWEKAESEAAVLKQEVDTLAQSNTALEARSSQLDQALKECVRQLRLAKEDQERKISEAVAVRNKEFELSKSRLEKQIVELLSKVEAASPVQIDPEINSKLEFLERENQRLKDELVFQTEELEIRTIERDLSTKAAETASKQNLESIKMVAKLESECRKLKAVSRKSSILQKSTSASSQSFDSEAVAFKILPSSSGKIDLMDDFLEMEKLAAMPENGHHPNPKSELPPQSPSKDNESLLREELKVVQCRASELEKKAREMEMASSQSQLSFENVEVELVETKMKLENLQVELQEANELKMDYESYANDLKLEARAMMSKIEQLEDEVDRQRVLSEKLSDRCQELENEVHLKNEELEVEVERGASSCSVELEEKERALYESRKRCDELEKQYKEAVMRFQNQEAESRIQLKAKETALAETEKCLEEVQLKLKEAEMKLETQIAVYSSEIKEKEETALAQNLEELQIQLKETGNKLEILQKELHEEHVSKEHLLLDLSSARAEGETLSAQIETLQGLIDQERGISAEFSAKCEELREELKQKEQELGLVQKNVAASVSVEQKKINEEDVANAAEKLAECQKTIASLGNQLQSLATLEDFLIDTASIPKFSGSAPLITNGGNELWKFQSNNFTDPAACLHTFSKYVDGEVLDSSSSTSTNLYNNSTTSQKRANGYEKLFPMRKG